MPTAKKYIFTSARKAAFRKAQEKAWKMRRGAAVKRGAAAGRRTATRGVKNQQRISEAKAEFDWIKDFSKPEFNVPMGDRTRGVQGSALWKAQQRDLSNSARAAIKKFKAAGGNTRDIPKEVKRLSKITKFKGARYPYGSF
jgi:hypothetical protein